MNDDMEVRAQDLASDEILELLLDAGADVSLDDAQELAALIASAGGLDEALDLVEALRQHRDAA